ncbi:hypothetical protein GY45DRAFT_1265100, partial [Cubamyces sp. BRFM 1775]
MNDLDLAGYDVLATQEPCLSFLNLTASTSSWRVVYPTVHGAAGATRSRAVIFVNKRLSTNVWSQIPV